MLNAQTQCTPTSAKNRKHHLRGKRRFTGSLAASTKKRNLQLQGGPRFITDRHGRYFTLGSRLAADHRIRQARVLPKPDLERLDRRPHSLAAVSDPTQRTAARLSRQDDHQGGAFHLRGPAQR